MSGYNDIKSPKIAKNIFFALSVSGSVVIYFSSMSQHSTIVTLLLPVFILSGYFIYGAFESKFRDAGPSYRNYIADSVYYMGFLFTLVEVAGAIQRIGITESEVNPLEILAPSLVAGLFATGCGLLFRAFLVWPDFQKRYEDVSEAMKDNTNKMELFVCEIEKLIDLIQSHKDKWNKYCEDQKNAINQEFEVQKRAIKEEFDEQKSTIQLASTKGTELIALAFEEQKKLFENRSSVFFKAYEENLEGFKEFSKKILNTAEIGKIQVKLNNFSNVMQTQIDGAEKRVENEKKAIKFIEQSIDDLTISINRLGKGVESTKNEFNGLFEKDKYFNRLFEASGSIKLLSEKTTSSFDGLSKSLLQLDEEGKKVAKTVEVLVKSLKNKVPSE